MCLETHYEIRRLTLKVLNSDGDALAVLSEDGPGIGYSIGALTPKTMPPLLNRQLSGCGGIRNLGAEILVFKIFGVNLCML